MKIPRVLLPCLALLGLLWLGVAQALPTVDEVQAATRRGDYAGAETLMREVVAARPDSARAHYVLAEILAHQRKFDEAAGQARRARALDPAIKFTEPARFDDFERLLQREQAAAKSAAASTAAPLRPAPVAQAKGGGVPTWLLLGGAIVFVGLAAGWMRRRAAEPAAPLPAGGVGAVPGLGPQAYGAGVPPVTGGGSGLLGVGLAAAGGVAAGMLAEKLLHEGHDAPTPREHDATGGGLIPGSFDADSAADELARRDVEFGSGDGWGGRDTGLGGEDW
ncbi:MAG: tetratricopeptide repeat protein [Comamonadaceae bacterium]|nr:tetratricopeptide repeat protein [Comamonadaceae bacterium]